MPSFPFRLASLLALLCLAGCAASPSRQAAPPDPAPLLLVSIDGLRADAIGRGDTPVLDALASTGVKARWMRPSYPVLTFPNHYTLATGLRPDHHGIIHNSMSDPELGRFIVADAEATRRPAWWQAQPIWTRAERAGLATGVWAWPGASAPRNGVMPRYFQPFDQDRPLAERMDTVLAWMSAPRERRARLAAVYLEQVDQAGHDHGPHADATRQAIRNVDAAIGRLLERLRAADIEANVVVVSDHGMADVPTGHYLAVEDMASMEEAEITSIGQVIGVLPRSGHAAALDARLPGRHAHYQCWRKHEIPAHLHYGTHPRIPPLVCQTDEGWSALPRATIARRDASGGHDRGAHGYDPDSPAMRAVFIAHGPAFKAGQVLPAFDNVDVYPLLARLLDLTPLAGDGNPATLQQALRAP